METKLTDEQKKQAGFGQWMHEATRNDGARLFTSVTYNHSTRGTWRALLAMRDGTITRLERIPRIAPSSRLWELTEYGKGLREEGRS